MVPVKVYLLAPSGRRKNYVMRWQIGAGEWEQKSTKTANLKKATKLAAQHEADLQHGRYERAGKVEWKAFRERFEKEHLAGLASNTFDAYCTALNAVEKHMKWTWLQDVTLSSASTFQSRLRTAKLSESSIANYLRHLQGAINWAAGIGLCKAIKIPAPKRVRKGTGMRGRPITAEEFDRLLAATDKLRPDDAADWKDYLTGLWLSGLRLEESLALSWDEDAVLAIDLDGRHPKFRIWAEGEKGFENRLLPMTPDFAEWLMEHARGQRGKVFAVGAHFEYHTVSQMLSEIGKSAKVVVNKAEGKFASAHDLRRSFGTRWAQKVMPTVLKELMRHGSIETTMKYYVAIEADTIADSLWQSHHAAADAKAAAEEKAKSSDTSCDTELKTKLAPKDLNLD